MKPIGWLLTSKNFFFNFSLAKFLVFEKGVDPNLSWKKFPYTLIAQAMPFQYEPDEKLIRLIQKY
jgi:hypothetical protein